MKKKRTKARPPARKTKPKPAKRRDLTGTVPESWNCIDCGVNTAPGLLGRKEMEDDAYAADLAGRAWRKQMIDDLSEVYTVKTEVWGAANVPPMGGCLCIGCLETRIGRRLSPKDFDETHPFHRNPGTDRLIGRRDGNFVQRKNGGYAFFHDGDKVVKIDAEADEWEVLVPGYEVRQTENDDGTPKIEFFKDGELILEGR